MQPDSDRPTNVQDSVVSGDVHTGNVIHNHYHLPPTPQVAPPPQTIIIQQPSPQQRMPFPGAAMPPMIPFKKVYGTDWIIFGSLSILFSFFPGLNACCGFVSFVGILSMLPNLNLRRMQPNHPDARKVVPAIVLNCVALFLILFSWILYSS